MLILLAFNFFCICTTRRFTFIYAIKKFFSNLFILYTSDLRVQEARMGCLQWQFEKGIVGASLVAQWIM